jgi:hypothetical protein
MISFTDVLILIGMFFLRVGVPLIVILGLGYLLKRLDARWEAEARAQRAAEIAKQQAAQPSAPGPAELPSAAKRAPTPAPSLPFAIPPAIAPGPPGQGIQPGLLAQQPAAHCWDVKRCSESKRAACAAAQYPQVPCWQARFDSEGHIPEECVNCEIFQRYPLM